MSYVRYTLEYLCNVKARDIAKGCLLQIEIECTLYERKHIFSMEKNSNKIYIEVATFIYNKLYTRIIVLLLNSNASIKILYKKEKNMRL